jgi:hypothetical protein
MAGDQGGVHLNDREAYRLYIHAAAGLMLLVDAGHDQARSLETTQHGELDWPDIVRLWGDVRETSRVLHRLWAHLADGGYLPSYMVPPFEEDAAPGHC